jgi:hypothetical membrane protein
MLGSATRPMATDTRPDRRVLGAVVLVLLAFWVLLTIAAMQQPGYNAARDSISSLASRGAHDAWIGIAALAVAGAGTIVMGTWLGRFSPPGGLTLGLAGVALLILLVAPLSCVGGAAACSTQSEPRAWSEMWHLVAVNLYEVMFVAAIAVAAIQLLHRGARPLALAMVAVALLSIFLFAVAPCPLGMRQRLWLALHSVVLVALSIILSLPVGRTPNPDLPARSRVPQPGHAARRQLDGAL